RFRPVHWIAARDFSTYCSYDAPGSRRGCIDGSDGVSSHRAIRCLATGSASATCRAPPCYDLMPRCTRPCGGDGARFLCPTETQETNYWVDVQSALEPDPDRSLPWTDDGAY